MGCRLTATPGIGLSDDDRSYSLSTYYHSNKISITDEKYTEIPNPITHLVEREFLAKIKRIDIDSEIASPDNATESDGEFKFTPISVGGTNENSITLSEFILA